MLTLWPRWRPTYFVTLTFFIPEFNCQHGGATNTDHMSVCALQICLQSNYKHSAIVKIGTVVVRLSFFFFFLGQSNSSTRQAKIIVNPLQMWVWNLQADFKISAEIDTSHIQFTLDIAQIWLWIISHRSFSFYCGTWLFSIHNCSCWLFEYN